MRSGRRWLLGVLLLLWPLAGVYAQQGMEGAAPPPSYSGRVAGDSAIMVGGLLHIPLFNMDLSKGSTSFFRLTNMTLGLGIEFGVSYFLTDKFFLGGGLAVRGIGDEAKQALWMFNLDALGGFELPIYTSLSALTPTFVLPFTLRLSLAINRYQTITTLNPALRPSVGIFLLWPGAPNWAVGTALDYWWMFDLPGGADNRIGNYLQINLGVRYYTY